MKLHEYQSKQIFAKYGVPIPHGRVVTTSGEVKHLAEELGGRVVIKAQVLVGGRGKAGGIRPDAGARSWQAHQNRPCGGGPSRHYLFRGRRGKFAHRRRMAAA